MTIGLVIASEKYGRLKRNGELSYLVRVSLQVRVAQ